MDYFKRGVYTKSFKYFSQIIQSKQILRDNYKKYVFNYYILSFILIEEKKKENNNIIIEQSFTKEADELYQNLLLVYHEKNCDNLENFITKFYDAFPEEITSLLTKKSIEILNYRLDNNINQKIKEISSSKDVSDNKYLISIKDLSELVKEDEDEIQKNIISNYHPEIFIDSTTNNIIYIPNHTKTSYQSYQHIETIASQSKDLAKLAKVNYNGIL